MGKITKKLIKIKDQDHTIVKIKIEIRGKIIFNDLRSMTRSRSRSFLEKASDFLKQLGTWRLIIIMGYTGLMGISFVN